MTEAQRDSFIRENQLGKFSTHRHQIYNIMRSLEGKGISINGLRDRMPFTKQSTIAGRVSELMDMGLVKESYNPGNNRQSLFHVVTDKDEQNQLMLNRSEARYKKWRNLGEELFFFKRYATERQQENYAQNLQGQQNLFND